MTATRAPARPVPPGPPADSAEHVVARLRRSGRRLVVPAVLFIALCGATGAAWGRLPAPWMDTALPVVALVLVIACCVIPLLIWMNRITIITSRRLIVKRGFFVRERTEFVFGRESEAALQRRGVQFLFGAGDVVVRTGSEGVLVLHDLPRAKLVHRAIADLIDHAGGTGSIPQVRRH